MKKKKVMFIDQLIDKELKILLSWKFIKAINSSPKNGSEPKWFKKLRGNITESNNFILKSSWKHLPWTETVNAHSSSISNDRRIKEWYCRLTKDNNIYWGKIAKKEKRNIFINHYNITNTDPENSLLTLCRS